jgi:hypothetical protein
MHRKPDPAIPAEDGLVVLEATKQLGALAKNAMRDSIALASLTRRLLLSDQGRGNIVGELRRYAARTQYGAETVGEVAGSLDALLTPKQQLRKERQRKRMDAHRAERAETRARYEAERRERGGKTWSRMLEYVQYDAEALLAAVTSERQHQAGKRLRDALWAYFESPGHDAAQRVSHELIGPVRSKKNANAKPPDNVVYLEP